MKTAKENKREVIWKAIRKEDGTKVNKEDGENNDGMIKRNLKMISKTN